MPYRTVALFAALLSSFAASITPAYAGIHRASMIQQTAGMHTIYVPMALASSASEPVTTPTPTPSPTPTPRPDNGDLVIDNHELPFTWIGEPKDAACGITSQSNWTYASNETDGVTNDVAAVWRPTIPTAGQYKVVAHIPSDCAGLPALTTNARYEVTHAGGTANVTINQSTQRGWVDLGTFGFNAGTSGSVRLTDLTSESYADRRAIVFDAVQWVPVVTPTPTPSPPTSTSLKAFWESRDFASGTLDGTSRTGSGDATSLVLNRSTLKSGTDTTGRYNRSAYLYGRYTGPVVERTFKQAVISWQANAPQGTWIEVELRARAGTTWTTWYSLGVWNETNQPFRRHSVTGQDDTYASVRTDTLAMKLAANAVQARLTLFTTNSTTTPTVRAYGISFANGTEQAGTVPSTGLRSNLAVPKRSQMIYPDGGEVWCSPTSTSMVMAYWAGITGPTTLNRTVPTVKEGVWDYVYNGGGNWPFNTAYAAAAGLESKVVRLSSLAEVEQWTAAGVPVIVSFAFTEGELAGTPIPKSNGHILVVRGFDAAGNVLVNDPAASTNEGVALTYNRLQFEKVWLKYSNGTAYLTYPAGWNVPASNGHW
jgi:hypothetical protein